MRCDGWPAETYSFYVLNTLTGSELLELRAHLDAGCETCKSELAVAKRVWTGVALAAPSIEPSRTLRKRVIASVQNARESAFQLRWWQPVTALAVLSLAVAGGWQLSVLSRAPAPVVQMLPPATANTETVALLEREKLEGENRVLRDRLAQRSSVPAPTQAVPPAVVDNSAVLAEVAAQRRQLDAAQQELARQKELLAVAERRAEEANRKYTAAVSQPRPDAADSQRQLAEAQNRAQQLERDLSQYKSLLAAARQRLETPAQSAALLANPNLKLVRLRGTEKGSGIEGHALLSSGSRVIFYASQLPQLPPGRAYQLWLIRASAPAIVSAGVFQPNAQRRATVQFEDAQLASGITAIAVTDEPEGGSKLPTGHKLLIGS